MMQIFVRDLEGNTTTLNMESCETIYAVKRKLKEKEGIPSDLHLGLIYNGKLLDDGRSLAHCNILEESTLNLFLSQHTLAKTWTLHVKTWSGKYFTLNVKSVDTIDDVKDKIQENEGIPQHKQLLFRWDEWLEDGSRTLADYRIINGNTLYLAIQFQQVTREVPQRDVTSQGNPLPPARTSEQAPLSTPLAPQVVTRQAKRARFASQTTPTKATINGNSHFIFDASDGEATAAVNGLMPETQVHPPSSVWTELEDLKREMVTARSKEKELEATISGLEQKCASYESQIVALKAENKETKEELTAALSKQEEQEATISRLTHKSKVFYDQCASFESQVIALEVANKRTKQELMNTDKKYYAGARAAGYAEGLMEGKEKWLKSVEFLHHLTDASVQYFYYGFDSCLKQAKQQGFVGQLNKDTALKEVTELKGWESNDVLSCPLNITPTMADPRTNT